MGWYLATLVLSIEVQKVVSDCSSAGWVSSTHCRTPPPRARGATPRLRARPPPPGPHTPPLSLSSHAGRANDDPERRQRRGPAPGTGGGARPDGDRAPQRRIRRERPAARREPGWRGPAAIHHSLRLLASCNSSHGAQPPGGARLFRDAQLRNSPPRRTGHAVGTSRLAKSCGHPGHQVGMW